MARNDETRARDFLACFQVDPSWYERYWWQEPAPRKPGIFAFFRRILSQQRWARRRDVRVDHQILHSPSNESCPTERRADVLLKMESGFGRQWQLISPTSRGRRSSDSVDNPVRHALTEPHAEAALGRGE
jgi:hypothetical protein